MHNLLRRCLLAASLALVAAAPASASTIALSDMSSDKTPASVLDASLGFSVIGGDTLQLVAANDTTAPNEFNINQIYWNASPGVSGLTLTSATHSVNGDVFAAWDPVETAVHIAGFGSFDFGLNDGVGEGNPDLIQPGTETTFVLAISGPCATAQTCTMADFFAGNEAGVVAAAKFVNGPGDDSAFGAANVPEPGTAFLLGLGLAALALRRRRA